MFFQTFISYFVFPGIFPLSISPITFSDAPFQLACKENKQFMLLILILPSSKSVKADIELRSFLAEAIQKHFFSSPGKFSLSVLFFGACDISYRKRKVTDDTI